MNQANREQFNQYLDDLVTKDPGYLSEATRIKDEAEQLLADSFVVSYFKDQFGMYYIAQKDPNDKH